MAAPVLPRPPVLRPASLAEPMTPPTPLSLTSSVDQLRDLLERIQLLEREVYELRLGMTRLEAMFEEIRR